MPVLIFDFLFPLFRAGFCTANEGESFDSSSKERSIPSSLEEDDGLLVEEDDGLFDDDADFLGLKVTRGFFFFVFNVFET